MGRRSQTRHGPFPQGVTPGWVDEAPSGRLRKLAWLAAIAIALGSAADAQAKAKNGQQKGDAEPTVLTADTPVRAEVDMDSGGRVGFKIDVPEDAVLMTIKVTQTPVGLDVMVAKDEPAESPRDADHVASPEALDTILRVSCQSLKPLEAGTYYIDVGLAGRRHGRHAQAADQENPFTVTVSFMRAKVEGVIKPGEKTVGKIRDEDGSLKIYAIDVPPEAKVLRIDLDDTDGDLDLFASPGKIVSHPNAAQDAALSPLGRETLVIDESSPQPLKPGRWYVCVVKPQEECANHFALYATFSHAPPAALLAIPAPPPPRDAKQRAILATVDVSTEFAGGSGTVLSEDGLILTNYHVIAEVAENPKDGEDEPVVIGLTLDPHDPPRELFRGKVVAFNKDIDFALIQVDCGFYRQPLPKDYRFVTIPLGDPTKAGDRQHDLGHRLSGAGRLERPGKHHPDPRRAQRLRGEAHRHHAQDRREYRIGQLGRGCGRQQLATDRRAQLPPCRPRRRRQHGLHPLDHAHAERVAADDRATDAKDEAVIIAGRARRGGPGLALSLTPMLILCSFIGGSPVSTCRWMSPGGISARISG